MPAQIIDGEAIAAQVTEKLKAKVEELKAEGMQPKLVAVLATENKGARIYANNQATTCKEIGIEYDLLELSPGSSEDELAAAIQKLNADESVSGIIVQMPLPDGVDGRKLQMTIVPSKDVEGMNPANQGRVVYAPQPFYRKPREGEPGYADWLRQSL